MLEIVLELIKKLEHEKDQIKKFQISKILETYLSYLSKEELSLVNLKLSTISIPQIKTKDFEPFKKNEPIHEELSKKVLQILSRYDFEEYPDLKNIKLKTSEEEEIINEILNDINPDYQTTYKIMKKEGSIIKYPFEMEEEYSAYCIEGSDIDKTRIIISDKHFASAEYISALTHELGHTLDYSIRKTLPRKDQISRWYSILNETYSILLERISIDYMINNRILQEDANGIQINNYLDMEAQFLLINYLSFCQREKNLKCASSFYIVLDENSNKRYNEQNPFYQTEFDSYGDYSEDLTYGYGRLLAEYLFNIYKQDKKSAFEILNNLTKKIGQEKDGTLIRKLGILESDFSFLKEGIEKQRKLEK